MNGMERIAAFRYNRCGAAQLPLQLVISIIVAVMVISVAYQALSAYQDTQAENMIQSEVAALKVIVDQVWTGGNGTTLVHTFNLPDKTEYVLLGGTLAADDKNNITIRYKLERHDENKEYLKCPLTSVRADGTKEPLKLGPGTHELVLTHIVPEYTEGLDYVKVQV